MISIQLLKDLKPHLKEAEKVWVAVALIKEDAYDRLKELINPIAKQNYLVGVDLPTSPQVLRKLQKKDNQYVQAGICKPGKTFHPKVYLIRKENQYTAFVGSGNLTHGGLEENIEMNFCIKEQKQCENILEWFEKLFKDAYPLTDENIREYERQFPEIETADKTLKLSRQRIKLKKTFKTSDPLDGIDFSDRYFKREHHWAFRSQLWEDDSKSANKEREKAKERFLELHEQIYPQFSSYGLIDLYPNTKNHIVSMAYHFPGQTSQQLNAMWLSYGKGQDEIKLYHEAVNGKYKIYNSLKEEEDDKQSFINHARLQVRIELTEIGIWLLFGKNNNGSLFDRQYFFDQMKKEDFRQRFYNLLKTLPNQYWIYVNNTKKVLVKEFQSAEELYKFCKRDNTKDYFIIGRDYNIEEPEMSEKSLPETVLSEFERLYPLYELMRDKRFV